MGFTVHFIKVIVMKNRISLDLSNMEAFKELTNIQLGELMRAVFAYASDGTMLSEDADQAVRVAFAFLKADVDAERDSYKRRCERNKENARKRWAKRNKSKSAHKTSTPKDVASPVLQEKTATVDYEKLVAYWNRRVDETKSSMAKVLNITPYRKKLIEERLAEYNNDNKALQKVLDKALADPYLNGKNPSKWVADFNWLLKPENFSRLVESGITASSEPKPQAVKVTITEPALTSERLEAERHREEIEFTRAEQQRNNLLAATKAADSNPNCIQARIAYNAYEDGTLARLGIEWTPKTSTNGTERRNTEMAKRAS
jgi:hypothetical protein|nr:MAG TPA: hypothetical protein [Caudoviricetes sp.]